MCAKICAKITRWVLVKMPDEESNSTPKSCQRLFFTIWEVNKIGVKLISVENYREVRALLSYYVQYRRIAQGVTINLKTYFIYA